MKTSDYLRYFRQCASLVKPGALYPGLEGRRAGDLLQETGQVMARLIIDPLKPVDTALLSRHGVRAFQWKLSAEPTVWIPCLCERLEEMAKLGLARAYHVIDAGGFFSEPEDCKQFIETLRSTPECSAMIDYLAYVLHPFKSDLVFHRKVLALFAEWPRRPAFVLSGEGTDRKFLSKALDWGYAGITLNAAEGFERAVTDRCFMNARMDREPLGKYVLDGGTLPHLRESFIKEAMAQLVLGNRSIAWDGNAETSEFIHEGILEISAPAGR